MSPDKVDSHPLMLPQAVDAVVALMDEDLMVKFEGMPEQDRKTSWAETGRIFTPFAEKIAAFKKTLNTAQTALYRTSRLVCNAGMTKDFDPVKDTLTMNLLAQICFARTLDKTGETNFTFDREASAMLTEIEIGRDALRAISRAQVIEKVLTGRLKLGPTQDIKRVWDIPILDESAIQRVLKESVDLSVFRGSIGELAIARLLPDYSHGDRMYIRPKSSMNQDDPRGGVFISVQQPGLGDKERTGIRLWQDSTGIMQAEATNPHPDITIIDSVRKAVLGIKLFTSYLCMTFEQRSRIPASRIHDGLHSDAFLAMEYSITYPHLAKYLIQQTAA